MKAKLTIGTRQSLLALWQSNHIAALLRKQYPECEVVLKKIVTKGDRILDVPWRKSAARVYLPRKLKRIF